MMIKPILLAMLVLSTTQAHAAPCPVTPGLRHLVHVGTLPGVFYAMMWDKAPVAMKSSSVMCGPNYTLQRRHTRKLS